MRRYLRVVTDGAVIGLAAAAVLSGFGVGAAQAETPTCKSVVVEGRVSPDSGENGNVWANATLTRKLEVCTTGGATDEWTYTATVTDSGEFVTLPGESPGATTGVMLVGDATGTVNGGFKATFTAPANWNSKEVLETPPAATTTGMWVETAFPGADFTDAGSVAEWRWVYNRCGADGFWWVNAETGSTGDILETACPTPSPSPSETTASPSPSASDTASPSPSASDTASPSPSDTASPSATATTSAPVTTTEPVPTESETTTVPAGNAGGLPLTGENLPYTVFAAGAAMVLLGAAGILVARRRRDAETE